MVRRPPTFLIRNAHLRTGGLVDTTFRAYFYYVLSLRHFCFVCNPARKRCMDRRRFAISHIDRSV